MTTQTYGKILEPNDQMPKKVRHLSSSIRKAKELADALIAERDHLQSALKESIRLQGEYAAKVEQLTAERDAERAEHDLISEWPNKDKEIFLLHEALRRYGDWSRMGTVEPQELQQAIDRAHSDASIRAMKDPTP